MQFQKRYMYSAYNDLSYSHIGTLFRPTEARAVTTWYQFVIIATALLSLFSPVSSCYHCMVFEFGETIVICHICIKYYDKFLLKYSV